MAFHMPTVCIDDVSYNVACMLATVTDKDWRLLTCPNHKTHDWLKIFHNIILRELYHDPRWSVPTWHAWQMPHTLDPHFDKALIILTPIVRQMITKNVFRDPQPVCIGDKSYRVTRQDGSTYEFIIP